MFTEAVQSRTFPGAVMGVAWGSPKKKKRMILPFGYTDYSREKKVAIDTVYDLASLTKPLATTLAILVLIKEQKLTLSDLIPDIFPVRADSFLQGISIKDLLRHSSGFSAHRPYYRELVRLEQAKKKEMLLDLLLGELPAYQPGSASVYSDLGFMLLGLIVEKKSGLKMDRFFQEKISGPLGIAEKIFFGEGISRQDAGAEKRNYAPTENCPFRKMILSGEVSDENAHALGGVAGHAGLFGTIEGVLQFGEHLLDQWQGREEQPNYRGADLAQFLIRQEIPGSTWALGFDTPSAIGSSGGRYLAPVSVGHLGFTGTSLWIDPTRELVMVLLSNRVHPDRENTRIKQFRPHFHETVMESLGLV